MAKKMIDMDLSKVARVAWLIQERVEDIEKFEKFLRGEYNPPAWKGVAKKTIEDELLCARESLASLLDDDTVNIIALDFKRLRNRYLQEGSE